MTPLPQGRPLRVLFCGSRDWSEAGEVRRVIDALPSNAIVIEGGATGADAHARHWARQRGLHVARVDALWDAHGRAAGPIRNRAMLALAPDRVVAFQRRGSSGTQDMIDAARAAGLPVRVYASE
jgi:hypothetical protein